MKIGDQVKFHQVNVPMTVKALCLGQAICEWLELRSGIVIRESYDLRDLTLVEEGPEISTNLTARVFILTCNSLPIGVYTDRERAEKASEQFNVRTIGHGSSYYRIIERTLDAEAHL